jgi:hypothetical protein
MHGLDTAVIYFSERKYSMYSQRDIYVCTRRESNGQLIEYTQKDEGGIGDTTIGSKLIKHNILTLLMTGPCSRTSRIRRSSPSQGQSIPGAVHPRGSLFQGQSIPGAVYSRTSYVPTECLLRELTRAGSCVGHLPSCHTHTHTPLSL